MTRQSRVQGAGAVWVPFTQGAALGYVLLPLRGVSLASFDTLSNKKSQNSNESWLFLYV